MQLVSFAGTEVTDSALKIPSTDMSQWPSSCSCILKGNESENRYIAHYSQCVSAASVINCKNGLPKRKFDLWHLFLRCWTSNNDLRTSAFFHTGEKTRKLRQIVDSECRFPTLLTPSLAFRSWVHSSARRASSAMFRCPKKQAGKRADCCQCKGSRRTNSRSNSVETQ